MDFEEELRDIEDVDALGDEEEPADPALPEHRLALQTSPEAVSVPRGFNKTGERNEKETSSALTAKKAKESAVDAKRSTIHQDVESKRNLKKLTAGPARDESNDWPGIAEASTSPAPGKAFRTEDEKRVLSSRGIRVESGSRVEGPQLLEGVERDYSVHRGSRVGGDRGGRSKHEDGWGGDERDVARDRTVERRFKGEQHGLPRDGGSENGDGGSSSGGWGHGDVGDRGRRKRVGSHRSGGGSENERFRDREPARGERTESGKEYRSPRSLGFDSGSRPQGGNGRWGDVVLSNDGDFDGRRGRNEVEGATERGGGRQGGAFAGGSGGGYDTIGREKQRQAIWARTRELEEQVG